MQQSKTCYVCKQSLTLDNFSRVTKSSDGYNGRCRSCAKAYYQKNRSRILEQKKTYYKATQKAREEYRREYYKRNVERLRAEKRDYYWENRDALLQKSRAYAKANREKLNAWYREYSKRRPDVINAKHVARRLRERSAQRFLITKKEHAKLMNSPCGVCGTKGKITIDHIIPLAKGGNHSIGNVMPMCLSCNTSKQDRLLFEFLLLRRAEAEMKL